MTAIVGATRVAALVGGVLSLVGTLIFFLADEASLLLDGPALLALLSLFFAVFVWQAIPHQSHNAVLWTMTASALFGGIYVFGLSFIALYQPDLLLGVTDGTPAVPVWVGYMTVIAGPAWVAGFWPLVTFGLLLFPDGTLPSPRWRWVGWLAGASLVAAHLSETWSFLAGVVWDEPVQETPFLWVALLGLMLAAILSAIGLVVRFRASVGTTRQQFKWVVWGSCLFLPAVIVAVLLDGTEAQDAANVAMVFAACVFLTSYGVAVGKYRLYDIDIVINRTVVLSVLAGFITVVYVVLVVWIGALVGEGSDGLLLPIAATALVAFAFEPVRNSAQAWANRLVYGRRATPYEVLAELTERLSHGEEGEGLLARMAQRLGDGTGAERATIWLGDEESMTVGASWPRVREPSGGLDLDAADVFAVTHDGVVVGAFEVVKPRGTALSTAERSLIHDLAGSAGAVLGYQRLNDSLVAKARELAESRGRLVEAQDRERRRLERDLHDGAQQLIVALKVKIGLARAMTAKHGNSDLESLLEGLGEEAQAALDEVRALAKGIYPPVLESDGLASAVSALASGAAEEVMVHCDGIRRYEREVEAAIYFEISEAVTNALKHGAAPITVDLAESQGSLVFAVRDSGPGFDVDSANSGSGLQNLRDRIDAVGGTIAIESSVGSPTTVRGSVPLEPVPV